MMQRRFWLKRGEVRAAGTAVDTHPRPPFRPDPRVGAVLGFPVQSCRRGVGEAWWKAVPVENRERFRESEGRKGRGFGTGLVACFRGGQ